MATFDDIHKTLRDLGLDPTFENLQLLEKLVHEYDWLAKDSILKDDPTYLEKITVYIGLRHLWLAMGVPYGPPPSKQVTKKLTPSQQEIFDYYRQKILNHEGDVDKLSDEAVAKMLELGPLWSAE